MNDHLSGQYGAMCRCYGLCNPFKREGGEVDICNWTIIKVTAITAHFNNLIRLSLVDFAILTCRAVILQRGNRRPVFTSRRPFGPMSFG